MRELKETREGVLTQAKETALSLAADGMTVDKIAYHVKVAPGTVQKWLEESRKRKLG